MKVTFDCRVFGTETLRMLNWDSMSLVIGRNIPLEYPGYGLPRIVLATLLKCILNAGLPN